MTTQCMQTRDELREDRISGVARLYAALADRAARVAADFADARTRRAAIRELASLSDRQLDDIGVSRHQIEEVVRGLIQAEKRRRSRRAA